MRYKLDAIAEWAALQNEADWVPLQGLVGRITHTFQLSRKVASELLVTGLAEHRVRALNSNTGTVIGVSIDTLSNLINWKTGELEQPGLPPIPLAVYWPHVDAAAGRWAALEAMAMERSDRALELKEQQSRLEPTEGDTIEGESPMAALAPPTSAPRTVARHGRRPEYDWPGLDAKLAVWLCDDGIPELQADLERRAMAWFPPDKQPSESMVRERVKRATEARRKADSEAKEAEE